ncbi:hypothetical protein [Absidia glauca]|uniref:Transcription activator GCR1-like domain-containing protein n=1 Tax=Absidia glauca TaxID=4829 RepID=A0A163JKU3_ABSGL|nr:hypothetical protein [Absidia glauca]
MHVQQNVAFFTGDGPCFFQNAGFEKIDQLFLGFSEIEGAECVDTSFKDKVPGMDALWTRLSNNEVLNGGKIKRNKETKFFSTRRSIITIITNFAQQHNITVKTAANVAEERRSRLNEPLHYLAEHNDQIFA